jgi:hypothetical protein
VPRYAAAGVAEVWIEDLENDLILVYRNPVGDTYATCMTLHRGESVSVIALPETVFSVDELLI